MNYGLISLFLNNYENIFIMKCNIQLLKIKVLGFYLISNAFSSSFELNYLKQAFIRDPFLKLLCILPSFSYLFSHSVCLNWTFAHTILRTTFSISSGWCIESNYSWLWSFLLQGHNYEVWEKKSKIKREAILQINNHSAI